MYLCKILCAPTPVCKRSASVSVCFRPSCQTAAILVSQTGREAGEARRSFEVLFSPGSFDPPRGNLSCCSTFLIPRMVGVRGKVFVPICCRRLNKHTLVCNRPVKVTKKCVWPWL